MIEHGAAQIEAQRAERELIDVRRIAIGERPRIELADAADQQPRAAVGRLENEAILVAVGSGQTRNEQQRERGLHARAALLHAPRQPASTRIDVCPLYWKPRHFVVGSETSWLLRNVVPVQGDEVDAVIGADAGLREVMRHVDQVAPTDAPVLLLGETGSGKDVVARSIHKRSARAAGPILRVNCGAIAPELIDSELFGHERGSFTGAATQRRGWFERASGGTLFLDEIGEMPIELQAKLLRVLQEREIDRVGGTRPLSVDVRIVAATNADLARSVEEGRFRRDLYYRLAVVPIRLPPLREREGDVILLARHFLAKYGEQLKGRPLTLAKDAEPLLLSHGWPGNVRELQNVVQRALLKLAGTRVAAKDLA
ncbi:MAG TPA: sigma 54-interacting transcriptional regulator, partial [Kofleriaceae bacterium]